MLTITILGTWTILSCENFVDGQTQDGCGEFVGAIYAVLCFMFMFYAIEYILKACLE